MKVFHESSETIPGIIPIPLDKLDEIIPNNITIKSGGTLIKSNDVIVSNDVIMTSSSNDSHADQQHFVYETETYQKTVIYNPNV